MPSAARPAITNAAPALKSGTVMLAPVYFFTPSIMAVLPSTLIFENRFKYVDELAKMGSNIKVEGNTAIIEGVEKFTSANLTAPDLRAGAALVLACLTAEGFSTVEDIKYIERGYEDFDVKLQSLGAQIEKVESEKALTKFKLKVG